MCVRASVCVPVGLSVEIAGHAPVAFAHRLGRQKGRQVGRDGVVAALVQDDGARLDRLLVVAVVGRAVEVQLA